MRAPPRLLRPLGIFLGSLALGLGILYAASSAENRPTRRGMRVEIVDGTGGPPATPIAVGAPSRLSAEGLTQARYRKVEVGGTAGARTTVDSLAWRLSSRRIDLAQETAEDVSFRLYPTPNSVEQAQAFEKEPPPPVAEIRAGRARVRKFYRPTPGGAGEEEEWEVSLAEGVRVESRRADQVAVLTAEYLTCLATERRVEAEGPVGIEAAEYRISGKGLSGDAALGTFLLREDIRVVLPTAAVLGEAPADAPAETVITCRGPLLVERLEEGDRILSRVTFNSEVAVVESGAGDRLEAGFLVFHLLLSPPGSGRTDLPPVEVRDLRAEGDIVLRRSAGSEVRAFTLVATRDDRGEALTLGGPVRIRHEGVLPGAPGPEARDGAPPEDSILTVDAAKTAILSRDRATGAARAEFAGAVRAGRAARDGSVIFSLAADALAIASDPGAGESMEAEGQASFSTPSVTGSADRLTWTRDPGRREEIDLTGNPKVTALGASGFDPFAPPAASDGGSVTLSSERALSLVTQGDRRLFAASGRSVAVKQVRDAEVSRVAADSLNATIAGRDLEALDAAGRVEAEGLLEGARPGRWFATGDAFRYTGPDRTGVLRGAPAAVRLVEKDEKGGERASHVEAPVLVFATGKGSFSAGEGRVRAVVFLQGADGGPPEPYSLAAGAVEVTTSRPAEGGGDRAPDARIALLAADGDVVLSGRDRQARGDRLRYEGETKQEISLSGSPALVTQTVRIHEADYTDAFRSPSFRLRLRDREIAGFEAPTGGTFTLHRPMGAGAPAVLPAGASRRSRDAGKVEQFTGSCTGAMTYDSRTARMTGNAWIEQALGTGTSFTRVARFQGEAIEASRAVGADGKPMLTRAEGRGRVVGSGDGWQVLCDEFSVDFLTHRTVVAGKPARVTRRGTPDQIVERAVYDYQKDEWSELVRARAR